jgi:hypothetical protein
VNRERPEFRSLPVDVTGVSDASHVAGGWHFASLGSSTNANSGITNFPRKFLRDAVKGSIALMTLVFPKSML